MNIDIPCSQLGHQREAAAGHPRVVRRARGVERGCFGKSYTVPTEKSPFLI